MNFGCSNLEQRSLFSFRLVHSMDIVPHIPACAKNHSLVQGGSSPCDPDNNKKSYHHGVEVWYFGIENGLTFEKINLGIQTL